MTSKSSFLVDLKENNKRRLWVWVVSALLFVLIFPVVVSITISQIKSDSLYLVESYGQKIAQEILHKRLLYTVSQQLGFSVKVVAVAIIAVISAVQGFSFLYSRKKMDFYMGMPVKRSRRFLIIWLNGILIYVLPSLLGLLIEILIAVGNGAVDKAVLCSAAWGNVANLFLFLGVYHLALLAVMLTGNVIITIFGIAVFLLYEYALRWTLWGYEDFFFRYFDYYDTWAEPLLSPFSFYSNLATNFEYGERLDILNLAGLFLFGAVIGVIAYLCYWKRPAEATGEAMAFAITKPVVKILITVPVSLLAGLMIAQTVGYNPQYFTGGIGYMIFTICLMAVIGSCVIQVIYEFDIKGVLHKKSHILISGIITALIFLVFRYDLLGYDTYVPAPEQVESIAFVPEQYESGGSYFDEEGRYITEMEYATQKMYLRNVEDVCELAEHSIEEYDKVVANYHANNYDEEEYGRWSDTTLLYRLKNGREVCRRLMVNVDDQQTIELLDRIIGSSEFKTGYLLGASDQLFDLLEKDESESFKVKASYGNTVYSRDMSRKEAGELLKAYQRDLAGANFSNIRENVPEGRMQLQITEEIQDGRRYYTGDYNRATRTAYFNINIYPFFEESIAYLKEQGYYMDYQLDPEDVAYIQVMNENSETYRRLAKESQGLAMDLPAGAKLATMDGDEIDTRTYAEYAGKEEIEEIAACCYPQELMNSYDWDRGLEMDAEYAVYVYFNTDSPLTKSHGINARFAFLEGQIPEFVAKDTAYKE